jgi:hypothetical protein
MSTRAIVTGNAKETNMNISIISRISLFCCGLSFALAALSPSVANAQQVLDFGNTGSGAAFGETTLAISSAPLAGQNVTVVSDQTLSQSNAFSHLALRNSAGAGGSMRPNGGIAQISTGNAIVGATSISNVSGIVNIGIDTGILSNVASAASVAINITNVTRTP